ncbi:MAG: hypothetical protein ACK45B_00580 [Limisphaerales bacterium]
MFNLSLGDMTGPRRLAAALDGVGRARVSGNAGRPTEFLLRWRERQRRVRVLALASDRPPARPVLRLGGGRP